MQFAALDDLEGPIARACRRHGGAWTLISGVGEDALDERKQCPCAPIEDECGTVAILNVCGMNGDVQQEPKRVDENVPLAAGDLLARVKALRIDKSPPFGAALALWLSMIAAVGLAWRPACSRVST